ncbi:Tripartite-type tricarboxylate transporter, receptor component TctC [Roseovarius marisflavi]|uniref:Tripartite-type tricarboxylate transporter, receptor component TctC n=1 Tax=Roseovarius marisflavi TaxID=1054996 RepID=A0A1M7AKH1_9RHOB|nr:tripartite tricarboxylate transporter substrate binding protein [Roseovarius marisflavi]SHL43281.1 Tripartite-type tricarboxylate transporter, receptor component TctC [Roseovarius marisflavi]
MKILKTLTTSIAALALTAPAAFAEWQPRKPVELIIMAGTGGGADQIARLLQGLIQKNNMSPRPFIPINKPGGSGAEALSYIKGKEGDNHTLLVALNSFYTTPIIQEELDIDVTTFAPIGRMAMDTFLLWVNSEREDITDLDSYVAAVNESGGTWKVGGTGSGQEDSILTAMMEKELGYNVIYIPFPGGGTVAKNLVGNQIDSTVNNPSEQMEFWRAGNTKPLVQFNGTRSAPFEDVPTAKELGVDIEYYMQRSISGPAGMDPEAVAWYQDLFEELFNSQEWQDYCKSDGLTCDEWISGDALSAFHDAQLKRHVELIEAVGADSITSK